MRVARDCANMRRMNALQRRLTSLASITLLVGLAHAAACATGTDPDASSGVGGANVASTSAGGEGGGTGGTAPVFPCGIDCSSIKTDACHVGVCNEATGVCEVVDAKEGTLCEDGLFCTAFDYCQKGICVPGPPNDCGVATEACQQVVCDEASKSCKPELQSDGSSCTDPNNLCTVNGKCQNGVCVGEENDCFFASVPSECFVAVCNPKNGQCEPVPGNDGASCTDSNDLCSVGNTCAAGKCEGGSPKDCSKASAGCALGVCDPKSGQCVKDMLADKEACNDLDACTTGEICNFAQNTCGGGSALTMCKDDDGCCPANCTGANDSDCTVQLAAGADQTCILRADGTVRCWGTNTYGQLGTGNKTSSYVPVKALVTGAVSLGVGNGHACAAHDDGTVSCWGYNSYGQLGDGTKTNSLTPIKVKGLTGAVQVVAGDYFTCARLSSGTIQCWGDNTNGQLGNGTKVQSGTPVTVLSITSATALGAGYRHACAIHSSGDVTCWGRNSYGQLGDGTTGSATDKTSPGAAAVVTNATALALGYDMSCARLSTGTVSCWGRNNYGQLGNGTMTDSATPVTVSGLTGAATVGASNNAVCAGLNDGTARCWGYNFYGQLGNGLKTSSSTPVVVSEVTKVRTLDGGTSHACALSRGNLRCWGRNGSGQLGVGTNVDQPTPVSVFGW